MKLLPKNIKAYKTVGPWTKEKIPAALLKAHNTKKDVWGKLEILQGSLTYTIEETNQSFNLQKDSHVVIEPQQYHFIGSFSEDLEIKITFYR